MALWLGGAKEEADRKQYPTLYSRSRASRSPRRCPCPRYTSSTTPTPTHSRPGGTGRIAAVVVTSGLLSMMDKRELQGVLAHEMSHIADNDMQFMTIAIVFAGAIGIIAVVMRNALFFGGIGGDDAAEGGAVVMILALLLGIVAPLFALLIRLAISRKREYMADANGARMIRDPAALAGALKKLQAYSASPQGPARQERQRDNRPDVLHNPFTARTSGTSSRPTLR